MKKRVGKYRGFIKFNKNGVSPVIATVLILLITIVAASIISVFVVPFVRESLNSGQECFDTLGDLKIEQTPYNCKYSDSVNGIDGTGFSIRVENGDIEGFKISLHVAGSADTYDILSTTEDDETLELIRMLGSDFGSDLIVPGKGGVRTYVVDGLFDKVDIAPILEAGKLCDQSDSVDIEFCTNVEIGQDLTEFTPPVPA